MAGGFAYGGGLSANSNNKVACCAPLLQAGNYVQLNSCASSLIFCLSYEDARITPNPRFSNRGFAHSLKRRALLRP